MELRSDRHVAIWGMSHSAARTASAKARGANKLAESRNVRPVERLAGVLPEKAEGGEVGRGRTGRNLESVAKATGSQ